MTTPVDTRAKSGGPRALHSSALARSRWRTAFLLSPPLLWFLVIYISSLVLMLVTSFWSVNSFTGNIDHQLTGANFAQITSGAYVTIIERTVLLAALVTITDAIVAFPFAYVMARVATRRTQRILLGAVLLPLWASYLAKVYAWISILEAH
jgi:putative spermidine/putrescine transport system permease protein